MLDEMGVPAVVRIPDEVGLVDLKFGGALLRLDYPAAAFVTPTAVGWLRGAVAQHADAYRGCVTAWRTAGLIEPDTDSHEHPAGDGQQPDVRSEARGWITGHPVLVIATSQTCGFCGQLEADIAANYHTAAPFAGSVVLVNDGEHTVWGTDLEPGWIQPLTGWATRLAKSGTPSAVLLDGSGGARQMVGYLAISRALTQLAGLSEQPVVVEAPSNCSVKIATSAPIDGFFRLPAGGDRLIGVAVRGEPAYALVEQLADPDTSSGYLPITLTLEHPKSMYLLFRGGELVARARTDTQAQTVLRHVLAGFADPRPGQIPLLAGAVVHETGTALLFPRTWLSFLVKRASQLAGKGWQVCPDPFLHLSPQPDKRPTLSTPSLTAHHQHPTLTGIMVDRPQDPRRLGDTDRSRLLTQIINWTVRPTTTEHLHTVAAMLSPLPIHAGTDQDAISLLANPPAKSFLTQ